MDSWFVEFKRKLDELDARSERRWAALEQRGAAAVEPRIGSFEQSSATQLIVADNWGGLFDEIPAPDTASFDTDATELVVADNWGGLFDEIPSDEPVSAPDTTSTDPIVPAAVPAATEEIEPVEFPYQIQELEEELQDANNATVEAALSKREAGMRAFARPPLSSAAPMPDAASDSELSGTAGKADSTDEPRLTLMYLLRQSVLDRLCELGPRRKLKQVVGTVVSVPVELARHIPDGAFRLGSVQCALRATPPGGYDGSLDDGPASGFAHIDTPLDRAVGRVGHALAAAAALRADAVGAAGGGQLPRLTELLPRPLRGLAGRLGYTTNAYHFGKAEATAESEPCQPASKFLSVLEEVYAAQVSKVEHPIPVLHLIVSAGIAILEGQDTEFPGEITPTSPSWCSTPGPNHAEFVPASVTATPAPSSTSATMLASALTTAPSVAGRLGAAVLLPRRPRHGVRLRSSAGQLTRNMLANRGVRSSYKSGSVGWRRQATYMPYQTVFEGMSAQITVLLEPLVAIEMSRHARLHLWQRSKAMLMYWNIEHTGCSGFTSMLTTALSSSTPTWVSVMVVGSFEHRYISTCSSPIHFIGVSLPGFTIDAHEVLMVVGRSCDANVLNLWLLFSPDWIEQQPWPPSLSGYAALMLLKISRSVVTLEVSFWWIQIAAKLPVVRQRLGIVTCSILPQIPWMSFDPGPLFKLELHYISKGDSLQYTLLLFLDSEGLQRAIHMSLICFLSYAAAKVTVTTSVQLFFQYYPSGLEYVLARPSYALGRGLTNGLELYDTRDSSGNYNKQWQLIFIQLSGKAKEHFLKNGDCFSACRVQWRIFVLFGNLLGGHRRLLVEGDNCFLEVEGDNCFLVPVTGNRYQPGSPCADPILFVLVCDALSYAHHVDQSLEEYDSFNSAQGVRPRLGTTELRVPWDPGGLQLLRRLEGKSIFKEGGMSDTCISWAASQMGLGPVISTSPSSNYKSKDGREHSASTKLSIENIL